MLRTAAAPALLGAAFLTACSPTFNWREVRVESTALTAMLPCKPDKSTREVPMAGRQVPLTALACEAGGATFALLSADIGEPSRLGEVLSQWKVATLSNMKSQAAQESPFRPPGALALPQSLQVIASGERADGSQLESHAAYFARGNQVFQAVIYSGKLEPVAAETFFSGLKLE